MSVSVPASVFDGRNYMVWWGTNSALKGLKGYVCMTPSDLVAKHQIDITSPGEGVDPVYGLTIFMRCSHLEVERIK